MINIEKPFEHHKPFIAVVVVVVLIIGLSLGIFLSNQLGTDQLGIVTIALSFTNVILLLIIGSLILDLKETFHHVHFKKRGKNK